MHKASNKQAHITIINIYAPTEDNTKEEENDICNQLYALCKDIPKLTHNYDGGF